MKTGLSMTLLVLVVGGLAAAANAQPATKCLRMEITANGSQAMWNHKSDAEKSAVAAWTTKAAKDAGPAYAKWSSAQRKSVNCVAVSKSTIVCTAKGTPCL
jgi:hypothetical protein